MENNKKKEKKVITVDDLEEDVQLSGHDEIFALKARIEADNLYTRYPDWYHDIIVPEGTVPSLMSGQGAWFKLNQLHKLDKPILHPVHVFDRLMMVSAIKVENASLAYKDEHNVDKIITNTKGYFCIDDSTSLLTIASAHVADVLSYYVRVDPAKNSIQPTIDPVAQKQLMMLNVTCSKARKVLCPDLASETKARDEIFSTCIKQPEIAYKTCLQVCQQNVKYSVESKQASLTYREIVGKELRILIPNRADIILPKFKYDESIIRDFYEFLVRSRAVRGSDKGVGTLTIGYILGVMSRTMVKDITYFLDLRQLLEVYKCKVLVVVGHIPELVMRMLVCNQYYVVSAYTGINKPLDAKSIATNQHGVYSSLATIVPYGVYHECVSQPAEYKKKLYISHLPDVMGIFNVVTSHDSSCVFHALRAHLTKEMDGAPYGLLPSALPHNGLVICATPNISKHTVITLARRAALSNYFRNNFLIMKKLWATVDEMRGECRYFDSFMIPKMRLKEKATYLDFSLDAEEVVKDVGGIEVPLGGSAPYQMKPPVIDADTVLRAIVHEMFLYTNIEQYAFNLCYNWGKPKQFAAVRVWSTLEGQGVQSLMNGLLAVAPKFAEPLSKGFAQAIIKNEQDLAMLDKELKERKDGSQNKEEDEGDINLNIFSLPPKNEGDDSSSEEATTDFSTMTDSALDDL